VAAEYDGADALMAAITGEPLPDAARADAEFMAGHRAALADVAVLREQLGIIGDALAAPPGEASSPAAVGASRTGAPDESERGTDRDIPHVPRPVRPARRGRALRIAFGSLAAVAALAVVVGLGRLMSFSGSQSDNKDSADVASSSAGAAGKADGGGPAPSDPEREVACSRLVVEGTVAEVGPLGDPRIRVVLTVTRYYRPDHGPARVTFLLDRGAEPQPRRGQHVLIRIPQGADVPTLWAVDSERVAANRAWITRALPGSLHTACPSGLPSGGPS
jgi:hypothetical protein